MAGSACIEGVAGDGAGGLMDSPLATGVSRS